MGRGFKQLSARDRVLISKLKEKKFSISEIARRIGRDKSTVSRELRRNRSVITPQDALFYFRIERFGIEQRPTIASRRGRLGDCEADLIVGYRQSGYVLSVVDRRSRATVLRKLRTKHMHAVRGQLEIALRQLGGAHTLTVDNGKEF